MFPAILASLLTVVTGLSSSSDAESMNPGTQLPEVVVAETPKVKIELIPLTVNIVTAAEIEKTAESSLLPILSSRVPGMFVSQRGLGSYGISGGAAGSVNIRGIGGGNQILFLIDGQPQWAGVFGHSVADTYNTNGVERVEVVKGPSSFLYGSNAMGGSVNIITRRPTKQGLHGHARALYGSYNTIRSNAGVDFRSGDFTAAASASYDRSDGNRKGQNYWLADERFQLGWVPSGHWSVSASADLTQSKAHNPGTLQDPLLSMWTEIDRGMAAVNIKNSYSKAKGGVQGFVSWGRHKIDDGYTPGTQPKDFLFNSDDINTGFSLYQTVNPWSGNDLSAGVDFLHWGGHNWNTTKADGDRIAGSEEEHYVNEIGAYAMMQQGFWDNRLSLNAGIRYQHGSTYGDKWIPQAGLIGRPWSGSQLKFNFSKGFRAPNIRELYLYLPANPNLKPEELYNYEFELRQRLLDNSLEVGLSLFYIDAKNLIQMERKDGRPLNVNTGALTNKGIEFDLNYRILDNLSVWANYAYLHTSRPVLSAPSDKFDAGVTWSPDAFEFSVEQNSVWNLYTSTSTPTLVNYTLLNLRAAWNAPLKGACCLRLFVEADNVTNRKYEILLGCPMPRLTVLGGLDFRF